MPGRPETPRGAGREAGARLGDGGGVGDHAHRALHLGQVAARHHGGRLVVDAALEAGGAPVHKLDGALGLDGGDRRVDVLGHHVTAVHQAARHVLRAPASPDQQHKVTVASVPSSSLDHAAYIMRKAAALFLGAAARLRGARAS